jgi:hypothetical protein
MHIYRARPYRLAVIGHWVRAILIALVVDACRPVPGGPTARPLDCMCVIHADAWALNAISLNNKVFVAPRNNASRPANFGDFRRIAGPAGNFDSRIPNRNTDGIPSVYAITETWFRGGQFNAAFRGQVMPIVRYTGDPGTGAAWSMATQDFTGTWRSGSRTFSLTDTPEIVPPDDQRNDDQLPQWMPVGDATRQMFACAGMRSEDNAVGTTWLSEVFPI